MSGAHNVTKLINQEESRAIYMHCYDLVLNLAVGDCMKFSNIYKDTLDTLQEPRCLFVYMIYLLVKDLK